MTLRRTASALHSLNIFYKVDIVVFCEGGESLSYENAIIASRTDGTLAEIAQLGVKWTAAFMVSCARHGATDFHSILLPSDHRQELFRREAGRSYGVLAKILGEAAEAPRKQFRAALLASGTHLIIASTGRGKGVGG